MQFRRYSISRELGIEGIDLTFGDWEIEALEQIGRRFRPGVVRQQQPVLLADYRNSRPTGVLAEENSSPTPNTRAIRSSVGSVGNSNPRSIFDSIRDFHDLWLLVNEGMMSLVVLEQAARALRDQGSLDTLEHMQDRNERQLT